MRNAGDSDAVTDLGLLALTVIWGVNFSVIKLGLTEVEPLAFNALRFPLAGLLLWAVLRLRRSPMLPPASDVPALVVLGVLGNVVYQMVFILGIDATLAGNASIILATVPVWTALMSAWRGHERPGPLVWLGVAGTLAGMALVVAGGASGVSMGRDTLRGDLLMIVAAVGWAMYTVGSRRLVVKHGPLRVTAWTIWVGTVGLVLLGLPALSRIEPTRVPGVAWAAVAYAGVFALAVAYVAWYRGVEKLGSSRTAVYSNLVPVVALAVAWLWLGERPGALQITGAGAVIGSLTLARLAPVGAGGTPEAAS